MFTMSLGGSSVKLETGKQINTEIRQKPLDNIKKYAIFVSFTKNDYVRIIIGGLGYLLSNQYNVENAQRTPWGGRLYLMAQTLVRTNCSSAKEAASPRKYKQKTRWKSIYCLELIKNKNIYEIPCSVLRDRFKTKWGLRKIKRWKKKTIGISWRYISYFTPKRIGSVYASPFCYSAEMLSKW